MVAEVPRTLAAVVEALLMVEVVERPHSGGGGGGLRMVAAVAALTVIAKTSKIRRISQRLAALERGGPFVFLDPSRSQPKTSLRNSVCACGLNK